MKQSETLLKTLASDVPHGLTVKSGKSVEVNGKVYRKRRGKIVEIPPDWVGQTLHPQTKRKRPSKAKTGKLASAVKRTPNPDLVYRRTEFKNFEKD